MVSRKMVCVAVVHQEGGLKVRQGVLVTEKAPYLIHVVAAAAIKLFAFQFLKLLDECVIDQDALVAVLSGVFIGMLTYPFS